MPALLILPLLAAAFAGGDDPGTLVAHSSRDVVRSARCTAGSRVRLDVRPDRGVFRVKAGLDQVGSRNGVRWNVVLSHDGRIAVDWSVVTRGTGDIDVSRRFSGRPGTDVFSFTAVRAGERCRVAARI